MGQTKANRKHGMGILDQSSNIPFTPTELAKDMLYYPIWTGHFYCDKGYSIDRETYPAVLLAYVVKGRFHVRYRGEEQMAMPGDIVYLDCIEAHHYYSGDELEFMFVNYSGQNAHEMCRYTIDQFGWIFRKKVNSVIYQRLKELVVFYENNRMEDQFRRSNRIYEMMMLLAEPEFGENPIDEMVIKSVAYIREHAFEKVTLQELADEANLSLYYYSHKFKERTGFAPMDFLTNTRLEKARQMLIETSLPVEEIAYEVGYASSAGLIKAFKKTEGISPNKYRKMETGK